MDSHLNQSGRSITIVDGLLSQSGRSRVEGPNESKDESGQFINVKVYGPEVWKWTAKTWQSGPKRSKNFEY